MHDLRHLQDEIDAERAQLRTKIDQLDSHLTPQHLLSEVSTQAVHVGGDLFASAFKHLLARGRAIPLMAALFDARAHKRTSSRTSRSTETDRSDFSGQTTSPAEQADLERKASIAMLRQEIASGTESLSDTAKDRVLRARTAAIEAIEDDTKSAQSALRSVGSWIKKNPSATGGIVVGVGAAIAIAAHLRNRNHDAARIFEMADRVFDEEIAKHSAERKT